MAKALTIPLDRTITSLAELPYTISYAIRKRQQIDSYNELEESKRPPDSLIWDGTPEEIESWLDSVLKNKNKRQDEFTFYPDEVE